MSIRKLFFLPQRPFHLDSVDWINLNRLIMFLTVDLDKQRRAAIIFLCESLSWNSEMIVLRTKIGISILKIIKLARPQSVIFWNFGHFIRLNSWPIKCSYIRRIRQDHVSKIERDIFLCTHALKKVILLENNWLLRVFEFGPINLSTLKCEIG